MDSSRRRLALFAIACFVIGAAAFGGAALTYNSNNSVETDGLIPLVSPGGMQVNTLGETNQTMTENFPTSGSVDVASEHGNISFFAAGDANATVRVDEITGTWTNVTNIDADPNAITINPEDKDSVIVGNEIDNISFRESYAVDDGVVDFVYGGATGQSRVTIQGVPANQQLAAVDADTQSVLDVATSGNSGSITFDALDNSEHKVLIQTADFASPTLSNADPTGDLSVEPNQLSVDVNDSDFNQGDSVEVAIELDGSQVHTETIAANQTVSTSIPQSGQTGGQHNWTVTATPDYGSETTEFYSYRVPDQITVRNESNHSEIINSPITSEVTFFGDDEIITRSTDDGTLNLTGLPVNQDFIAQIEPSDDNYTSRVVYLESIYQQQDVYLLNTSSHPTTDARFILEDPTAQFGSDTVLFIERPLNASGTTTWKTIHADEFGAEGVTATLENGQRYRLRVKSASGTEQVIGPYRADVNETVTVQPGTPSISLGDYEEGVAANALLDNRTLEYRYSDPTGETDRVTIHIHEKGNVSNRLQANESYFNLGNFTAQSSLTANESEKTWVVNFHVDRDDEQFVRIVEVGNRANILPGLPEPWGSIVGIGLLLLLGAGFSILNAATGAVVVASVGGIMYFLGLLGGAATGAGIVLGLFVAVINAIRVSKAP